MNHILITLLFFFTSVVESEIYDGKFFDPRNYTYADCILLDKPYIYIGEKSTDKTGNQCEIWKTVTNLNMEKLKGFNIFFFAEEYFEHNHCRNIPLDAYERNSKFNNASAHLYVQTKGWKNGPWCYVKVPDESNTIIFGINDGPTPFNETSEYAPMPCFKECNPRQLESTTVPPQIPRKKLREFLYNNDTITIISNALYSSFDHGDSNYYISKPSTKVFSAHFLKTRKQLVYYGMPLFVLVIASIFAKHYYSKWRADKKAAKKKEKDVKKEEEAVENNNQNEKPEAKEEAAMVAPEKISQEKLLMQQQQSPQKKKLRKR